LIRLESGEAIFQVAGDPSRPFVVETGPVSIEALGTKFDVYRKELSTRVAVSEGAVQVSSRGTTSLTNTKPLTILQQIDVPDDTAQPRVRRYITSHDFERMTAWVHGDIQLEGETLKETLGEFARYQHIQVDFRDPGIAEVRFGGVFHTTDVDTLLKLLKLKCIHSEYDKAAQRITLTSETGKRAGTGCQ
jgi:transmembrane sensor